MVGFLDSASRVTKDFFAVCDTFGHVGAENNSDLSIQAAEGSVHGIEPVGNVWVPGR
jgi:hypothetical protein